MKFITGDELRELYEKEPFTTYELDEGTRLTPGAEQFLLDHRVKMNDEAYEEAYDRMYSHETLNPPAEEAPAAAAEPSGETSEAASDASPAESKEKPAEDEDDEEYDWRLKMVESKLASVEALFLQTEATLLNRDVLLAQTLSRLLTQFIDIWHMIDGEGIAMDLPCKEAFGITEANFSKDNKDTFEVTEFHVHLPKTPEILALHRLRCALREIKPTLVMAYDGNQTAKDSYKDAIAKINQVINTISQMICTAVGA